MQFMVFRSSQGAVTAQPPCRGAVRGREAPAWPGEYEWFIELASLEEFIRFLDENGGALGVFAAEEGEELPAIEIFDDDEEDEDG